MIFRNIGYFSTQLWYNISRNFLMSFAAISTSAISLLTLGVFLIMVFNINQLTNQLSSQVEIRAFLKKDITNAQVKNLADTVERIPQVKSVAFVSPEEALKWLEKNINLNLDMSADENPLPPTLVIHVSDPRQTETVASQISGLPGIDDMKFGATIVRKILALSITVKFLGFFVTILMGVGTLFTLINTIRLTVIARRAEIRTMQFVGATGWFIRWPFLLEGIFIGIMGAVVSAFILSLGYMILAARIQENLSFLFPLVDRGEMARKLFWLLCTCGVLMGITGSYISVTRFLEEEI
jgi:cell division transport system permease protein